VAEGYYGSDWVKYVYKVTADIVEKEGNPISPEPPA
jgi:hypothetical protein